MDQLRIEELVNKWRLGTITEKEMAELNSYYDRLGDQEDIILSEDFVADEHTHAVRIWSAVQQKTFPEAPVIRYGPQRRKLLPAISVAASVLLILAAAAYLLLKPEKTPAPVSDIQQVPAGITPGRNGAVLILADGKEIALDSIANGLVATEGGARVLMKDNQLMYESGNGTNSSTAFNTMSTPKGRQFKLVLPDGTKVWLNAASSIRYPVRFPHAERKVMVTGEAYFEVAKDRLKPFRVEINDMEVEVLGTAFNINGYTNEEKLKTTLLEGAVRLTFDTDRVILKPGQQAVLPQSAHTSNPGEKFSVTNKIDQDQVIAWKNSIFNFNNTDLFSVMRQLERWYGIDVEYEGHVVPVKFFGKMRRDLPLGEVLDWLKGVGVNYRFDNNNKLIIMP